LWSFGAEAGCDARPFCRLWSAPALLWSGAVQAEGALRGDLLQIGGQYIRLYGIEAFTFDQICQDRHVMPWRCGVAAKALLDQLVENQSLNCVVVNEDHYGRYTASCTNEDGVDLAAELVRRGLALAHRVHPNEYGALEDEARTAEVGAWAGSFVPPWDWRR
jgi:endonuclease YncB( thermonuclease family)